MPMVAATARLSRHMLRNLYVFGAAAMFDDSNRFRFDLAATTKATIRAFNAAVRGALDLMPPHNIGSIRDNAESTPPA